MSIDPKVILPISRGRCSPATLWEISLYSDYSYISYIFFLPVNLNADFQLQTLKLSSPFFPRLSHQDGL